MKSLPGHFSLILFIWIPCAWAENSTCQKRLEILPESSLLFSKPEVGKYLSGTLTPAFLRVSFKSWSTDLLVKVILELEQEYLIHCPTPKVDSLVAELKRVYLSRLGVAADHLSEGITDEFFRGLIVLRDDVEGLRSKIVPFLNLNRSPTFQKLLSTLYGYSIQYQGVTIVGGNEGLFKQLQRWVDSLCGGAKDCLFWNAVSLYKVVLTPEKGLAAYLPEVAELVLSHDLLKNPSDLHRFVVVHELSHIAERSGWFFLGKEWKKEFEVFSTDKITVLNQNREDALTRNSVGSSYSILPDPIVIGRNPSTADGFVLARTWREVAERKDVSEDLADHVSAFVVAPTRFCFQGKPIASRKHEWIRKNLFPKAQALSCH